MTRERRKELIGIANELGSLRERIGTLSEEELSEEGKELLGDTEAGITTIIGNLYEAVTIGDEAPKQVRHARPRKGEASGEED